MASSGDLSVFPADTSGRGAAGTPRERLAKGHYAEARGLVPQTRHLLPGMSAHREVSRMASVAPGAGCVVAAIFLSADLPE